MNDLAILFSRNNEEKLKIEEEGKEETRVTNQNIWPYIILNVKMMLKI